MAIKKNAITKKLEADRAKEQGQTEEQKAIRRAKQKQVSDTTAPMPKDKTLPKRVTHKVFSFWAKREDIAKWQAYLKTSPELKTVEALGTAAINEYIKNHPPVNLPAFYAMKEVEEDVARAERAEAEAKYL